MLLGEAGAGAAAETGEMLKNAKEKLKRKTERKQMLHFVVEGINCRSRDRQLSEHSPLYSDSGIVGTEAE